MFFFFWLPWPFKKLHIVLTCDASTLKERTELLCKKNKYKRKAGQKSGLQWGPGGREEYGKCARCVSRWHLEEDEAGRGGLRGRAVDKLREHLRGKVRERGAFFRAQLSGCFFFFLSFSHVSVLIFSYGGQLDTWVFIGNAEVPFLAEFDLQNIVESVVHGLTFTK